MDLSIVIPAYNEAVFLPKTISKIKEALAASQWSGLSWEIIVCDNNSLDETAAIAQDAGAIIVFEPKQQIASARNTGAAIAKGTWLLFIDADTYPSAELMGNLFSIIQTDIYIGAGSTVKVEGGALWNRLRMERLNPLMRGLNWCGGAFLLCKKEVFDQLEGFSPDLFALEEIEFIIRLRRMAKRTGKKFTVLYQHPVVTSGRKGENTLRSFLTIFFSNTLSFFWLILHLLLPRRLRIKGNPKYLGFWYNRRNNSKDGS